MRAEPDAREGLRWRQLFDETPLPLAVADWGAQVLEANRALAALLGFGVGELVGRRLREFSHRDDRHLRFDLRRLTGEGRAALRKRLLTSDGRVLHVRVSVTRHGEDDQRRLILVVQDETTRVDAEAALVTRATTDPGTGLPLRSCLAATSLDAPTTAVAVALDQLPAVHDALGTDLAEQMLCVAADRLAPLPGVRVGRGSADQLVLLGPAVVPQGGDLVAAVRQALSGPVRLDGREIPLGACLGVATSTPAAIPPPGPAAVRPTAAGVLRDAETALAAAQRVGRGACVVLDPALRDLARGRLDAESALRRAVEHPEQFEVHYQPLTRCDGSLHAVEALVRWQHPERGLLPPGDFLPLAEETGLIVPLGAAVLRAAVAQVARWQRHLPHLRLAVNIAAEQLTLPGLEQEVLGLLDEHGLPAAALGLEITESTLVVADDQVLDTLHRLRAAGCFVALDDFGTGHSSLAYLGALPVDAIKVDRAFVHAAGPVTASRSRALLRAVVAVGRSLDLAVVAEGVETPAELALLRELEVDLLQGFLLGRPVPAREFDARVREQG